MGIVPTSWGTWFGVPVETLVFPAVIVPFPMLLPNKIPGIGVPTWQYDNAVRQILPDAKVLHLTRSHTRMDPETGPVGRELG